MVNINWNRSILVDDEINEALVRRLTPQILALRQQSDKPITIGIDSPGGSLRSMDVLLGLLRGPDQAGKRPQLITVVTNKAYSAAANLLAYGDFAVAMPHSSILMHDVRYSELSDVTPEKAKATAKALTSSNHRHALRLAEKIVGRLLWNYLALADEFDKARTAYPKTARLFDEIVLGQLPDVKSGPIQISSFAVALFRRTSSGTDQLVEQTMNRLKRWVEFQAIESVIPLKRSPGSRQVGLLDGPNSLLQHLWRKRTKSLRLDRTLELPEEHQEGMSLLITLAVTRIADGRVNQTFDSLIEDVLRDFEMIRSMNSEAQLERIVSLMEDHSYAFLGPDYSSADAEQKQKMQVDAFPYARIFWYFCVLLCRSFFVGDNILTPGDAQLLGIVDEVSGGGPIQSIREYGVWREGQQKKGQPESADAVATFHSSASESS